MFKSNENGFEPRLTVDTISLPLKTCSCHGGATRGELIDHWNIKFECKKDTAITHKVKPLWSHCIVTQYTGARFHLMRSKPNTYDV